MALKCLLAIVAVGLLIIGALATGVAALSLSARFFVAWTGTAIPFRTSAAGGGEGPLDATGPFVAYTLVLSNNTLIPGNFLAKNSVATPDFIAYDAGKGEVFVTDERSNNVTVISDSTNSVIANIPVGSYPVGVAYDGRKGEVFVTNEGAISRNVTIISDATLAVIANVPVGSPQGAVAYDAAKGEVFVAIGGPSSVAVISDATNAVIANIPVDSTLGSSQGGMAYDAAKGEVFVANGEPSNVTVISDATNAVIANIPVGSYPIGVTYDPRNAYIYVANYLQGTISIISTGGQAPRPPTYVLFLGATAFVIVIAVVAVGVVFRFRQARRKGRIPPRPPNGI